MACLSITYYLAKRGGRKMSLFVYFVIFTIIFTTLLGVLLTVKLRKRLTNMHGMNITMIMGMNVGLTSGVLFGALYQGDLYYSTILSICIGSLVGLAFGVSLGLLPSLEGFMSGLMGGMMGAMLGEMITTEQSGIMINILLSLTVSSLLLFKTLPNSHVNENKIEKKSWFFKPLLTFIFLFTFLLFGSQLDKKIESTKSNYSTGEAHIKHGNQGESINEAAHRITVNVHPKTFSYSPSKVIVKKNNPVTISLVNYDSLDHDIEIKNISIQKDSEDNPSHHPHAQGDFHLHALANNQAELSFTPLKEGIYKFYCSIPGHTENGMIGEMVVVN
jgi:uncharacterized cupredoxin-like copper-binding protein